MTTKDEANRKLLQARTAKVTVDRLSQIAIIDHCTIGEILDQVVEELYNSYVAQGKVRNHLKALQSMEETV